MKIPVSDINPSLHVAIDGHEPWLARLYADFPVQEGVAPKLTGALTLARDASGSVEVTGKLNYAPSVACSRCDQLIPWQLQLQVAARYLPETSNPAPRERNLSKADLDAYDLKDQMVDLEGLVTDTVLTGLPSQLLAVDENGDCRVCHADLSQERVFGAGPADSGSQAEEPGAESPFAVLKGLKLPH